jgi:hypothetical protein
MFERETHRPAIRVRFIVEWKIRSRPFFIFPWGRGLLRRRWVRLPLGFSRLIFPV